MKYCFIFFLLLLSLPARAAIGDTFVYKGINYRVTGEDTTGYTAQVDDNKTCTLNKIIIPDSVDYNSLRYAVTAIRDSAFFMNSYIDTLDLSTAELLTLIDSVAFESCVNLSSVSFPDSLKIIGRQAFAGCFSLDSICLPSGIDRLGTGAFGACISLRAAVLSEGITDLGPGDSIFSFCWALDKVYLPSTLRRIGRASFSDCESLETLFLPDSISRIENFAFARTKIDSMVFPAGLDYLGYHVFDRNFSLKYLDFSKSVRFKRFIVFTLSSSSVETIIFPPNLVTINHGAFLSVYALKEIILPDSLKKIENGNFYPCTKLQYLLLPAVLDSIGKGCFRYCPVLRLIDNLNPVPQDIDYGIDSVGRFVSVFYGLDRSTCKLRVPCTSIPLYRNTPVWQDFHILDCYEVIAIPNDNNYGTASGSGNYHEEMQDTLIASAYPSYEFVYWKDLYGNVVSYNDTLVVTAMSDTTLTAYFRPVNSSADAALFSLTPSHGKLVPDFNSHVLNYVDTVPYAVDSIQFHVITNHPNAVVNEADTTKKELSIGDNEFTITVTAEDLFTTETYTVKVYRLNNNAYLHDLQLQGIPLSPVFDSLTYVYSAQVPALTSSINLIPVLSDPKASFYGDYGLQNLAIGTNRFDILVKAEDRDTTRTYTVDITRENYPPSTSADLVQVNVNGTDMLSLPTNRFNSLYSGDCEENTFMVILSVSEGATLDIENPFTVTINEIAGLDTVLFTITSEDRSRVTYHRLVLEKRFDFDIVVETMWNDNTFMLDIRYLSENNIPVHYESKYQWYKNGKPVFMGIYPTLSAGEQSGARFEYGVPYYLEMATDKKERLRTCEKILLETNLSNNNLYPNPAEVNEPFTLLLDESIGIVEVFNVSGIKILEQDVYEQEIKLSMPLKGTYIIKHAVENKENKTYKVIIH